MKTETQQAIEDAIKVASDNDDLSVLAALCFFSAICKLDGERELADKLSPMASQFLEDKKSFPQFLELEEWRIER